MLLPNTQKLGDIKYALSISPFLVLDDNTRICNKAHNKYRHVPQRIREAPPTCVHTSSLHLNTNAQHVEERKLTRNIEHDKFHKHKDISR